MHAQCKYKPVVADSGGAGGQGGPGGPGHPLFSDQTEARRAEKKLSSGLNDRSPPPPPPPHFISRSGWALASVILTLLEMRLSQKTLRAYYGPAAKITGNKPRGVKLIKRKTQLSRKSNLDHLYGRSAPLHQVAKENVKLENYCI